MAARTDGATMLHVHDLGRAELVDCLVQRLDAEVRLKRVRYPPAQQIVVGLVPLRRSAGVGLLEDRHQSHEAPQPPDAFLVHGMALVLQVPGHLADPIERSVQELPVDQQHEVEVHRCLALRSRTITARSTADGIAPRPTAGDGPVRSCRASLADPGLELS